MGEELIVGFISPEFRNTTKVDHKFSIDSTEYWNIIKNSLVNLEHMELAEDLFVKYVREKIKKLLKYKISNKKTCIVCGISKKISKLDIESFTSIGVLKVNIDLLISTIVKNIADLGYFDFGKNTLYMTESVYAKLTCTKDDEDNIDFIFSIKVKFLWDYDE